MLNNLYTGGGGGAGACTYTYYVQSGPRGKLKPDINTEGVSIETTSVLISG